MLKKNPNFVGPEPLIDPAIGDLPTELTIDILSRLPVKTILRCKKWRNLVSDSSFVNLNLSRSPTGFIVHQTVKSECYGSVDPGTLKWVEIEDKVDHHRLHHELPMNLDLNMVPIFQTSLISQTGSVNGLICLWQHSREHDNTFICNPVTREILILPRPRYYKQDFRRIFYGFGVSSLTGEYKVVRTFKRKLPLSGNKLSHPCDLEAEVYTLGTGQWRNLGRVPYRVDGFSGLFLNNRCHWILSVNEDSLERICTFDLNTETFQLFPSPPFEAIQENCFPIQCLGVLKGCLCKSEAEDFKFTIWMMKEYNIKKSWHKEVVITEALTRIGSEWPYWDTIYLIEGLKDGTILFVCGDLCAFYPRSDTIEQMVKFNWLGSGITYRPSFLKLQNFESERVHITLIHPSMEELPKELTMDILSRLPVKTIVHCKRVCKKWRNLVSDSSFVNLHLSRSPTPTDFNFIIHTEPDADDRNPGKLQLMEIEDKVDHHHLRYHHLFILDLNLVPILEKTRIFHVGSVNGLICLWQYTFNLTSTYICNLVTRECMILPRQHFFWDSIAGFVYGFGVSSLTGEYKVVRAFQWKTLPNDNKPSQPSLLEVEVYTIGTGQWRSRGPVPVPYRLYSLRNFNGTFLNNHCHWIVCDMENTNNKIAAFDLDKETFQLFPSPPSVKENRCHYQTLAILRGCLCNLATCSSQSTIWMMKEYGNKNSWHKEVVITRETIVGELRWFFKDIHLIEGLRDGRILMVFENKLCVFDPRSQTFEDPKMFDPKLGGWAYRPSFIKLENFESEMVSKNSTTFESNNPFDSASQSYNDNASCVLGRITLTIVQRKHVCKKWRNLVLDSSFVKLHLSKSPTTGLFIHQYQNPKHNKFGRTMDPGILKWVEIKDKVDQHHLLHDPPISASSAPHQHYLQALTKLSIGRLLLRTHKLEYP
ncbi:hypothetical protein OSB04_016184 [Centaurea solstitialis]|uniref:F-box domain-containing protein n=1 Tax=Centaurea solstitialis TaxID=347529 RepID=A0AA38WJG4_9ASTR|nr:hypothetical protein OSB04_016184 [Centaurea solstitialis]